MKVLFFNDKPHIMFVELTYTQVTPGIRVMPGEYKEIEIVLKEDEGLNIRESGANIILITSYKIRKY